MQLFLINTFLWLNRKLFGSFHIFPYTFVSPNLILWLWSEYRKAKEE
jgi:hypothetical protein